ncbi:F0F1 ATP synthase subunit delta [Thiohalocapsa marina]|uniref:ATP synthase subunit delta n=1 Tax=Thiohalocapsa marina TaxID=424902 RepID=A0A5M8FRB1_9GAMM|nr:F0F1 ATP synthase subunit delta [Thiohalocapsa marina]KAA6185951.1 F0F1 ATP synthase subunit delta [Thiohalocapsa marina]
MAGDSTTIARPYAEAAFEVAKSTSALDAWSDALNTLAGIVDDPLISDQVGNPNVPRETLRDLIFAVAGDGLTVEMQNLVRLLADNKRLAVIPEVARLFDQLKTAAEGLRHVAITSAFAVSDDEQKSLANALRSHFGSEVELTVEQDSALIGGIKIHAGDIVIDGSIRGKLEQLSNELQF